MYMIAIRRALNALPAAKAVALKTAMAENLGLIPLRRTNKTGTRPTIARWWDWFRAHRPSF
jgi:hypothetical protein